jgi:hypothetical protein
MRFDSNLLAKVGENSDVVPGNVYQANGGRKSSGTKWWLVVAVSKTEAHCVGFDECGYPCSTDSYLKDALRERPIVGRCDLDAIQLTLTVASSSCEE